MTRRQYGIEDVFVLHYLNEASVDISFLSLSLSFSLFVHLFHSSTLNTRSFEYHRFLYRTPIHTIIREIKFLFIRALFGLVQFFVTDYRDRCRVVAKFLARSCTNDIHMYALSNLHSCARILFFLTCFNGFTRPPLFHFRVPPRVKLF